MYAGKLAILDDEGVKHRRRVFDNPQWNQRRIAIAARVARRQAEAHERAVKRKKSTKQA